jgi:hypothetical protein
MEDKKKNRKNQQQKTEHTAKHSNYTLISQARFAGGVPAPLEYIRCLHSNVGPKTSRAPHVCCQLAQTLKLEVIRVQGQGGGRHPPAVSSPRTRRSPKAKPLLTDLVPRECCEACSSKRPRQVRRQYEGQ